MVASDSPIAWTALEKGTLILAADGTELGKVADVIADEQKDIFSGLTLNPGLFKEERFIPADLIDRITSEAVHLNISAAQAETQLQPTDE
jgi:uncharacterized protein YrrD